MRRAAVIAVMLAIATAACGGGTDTAVGVQTVSAQRAGDVVAGAADDLVVLDIRTPAEFAEGHLAGAVNIDYYESDFADRMGALDRTVPYVMYCRSGNRSAGAADLMRDLGFDEVYEISGGIVAWVEAGLPVER